MRLRLGAFSRYRPRALTAVVFAVVAAMLVLSNLTYDKDWRGPNKSTAMSAKSYGWPLVWRRFVSVHSYDLRGEIGWYYSTPRLAANVAMWLVMLIAPPAACERLLRRRRPGLHWSLRTMLLTTAFIATFLAWFAVVRERANRQDAIAASPVTGQREFERWGPKWLDLVGADRFRREIVFLCLKAKTDEEEALRSLKHLKHLSKLRQLRIEVDRLSPQIADALSELRQVRLLSIEESEAPEDDDQRVWAACLTSLGKMTQLEYLHMSLRAARADEIAKLAELENLKSLSINGSRSGGDAAALHECLTAVGAIAQLEGLNLSSMKIPAESLASLGGLTSLQRLSFEYVHVDGPSLLDCVPALPALQAIDIERSRVADVDLRRLAGMPRLRSIGLIHVDVSGERLNLAELAASQSLEEVAIDGDDTWSTKSYIAAAGIESLLAVKRLKAVHWARNSSGGPESQWTMLALDHGDAVRIIKAERDRCRRALQSLRKAHPGIAVDADIGAIEAGWPGRSWPPVYWFDSSWLPSPYLPWMTPAERAEFKKADGWASFDGAGFRDRYGHTFAASF